MSPLLVLAWMPNDVARTRVGFVISKRIAKHAVDRNYMKRLLSEAMRGLLPRLPGGIDIVVSARQKANTVTRKPPRASFPFPNALGPLTGSGSWQPT